MSELKCCKICGAFSTCDHKGECCPECEHFDPVDLLCMAGHLKKKTKEGESKRMDDDVDPETFLFEDDEDDEVDESKLPPERDSLDKEWDDWD